MYGNREKGILRRALEGLLPEEVLYRKKSPYPKTHHPLYTELVKARLTSLLNERSSILHEFFEAEKLKEMIETGGKSFQAPWFGQLMTGPQLLAYLCQVHDWFEHYGIDIKE